MSAPVSGGPGTPRAGARRIRIVYCLDSMNVGGTELNAIRTAERLDRDRFDLTVTALRPEGPLAERYEAAGVPVFSFPIPSLYGPAAVRQGLRFARFLRERRVDIVHSHDQYNNVFASIWARAAGTPVVIASRRWWQSLQSRKQRASNALGYRFAHYVLANSPSVARLLREGDHVSRRRILLVSNFVDEDAFTPPTAAERAAALAGIAIPEGAITIGVVANLHPPKDQASLLRAVAALTPRWPQLHVVLVGRGECLEMLGGLARELAIGDRVHFAGYRSNRPNLNFFFDISVLCSLSEGFPNTIIEAMAAGRPVIATSVGGIPDAVEDGETGLLVPTSSPDRLAAAVAALAGDPARRRAMGALGRARARERYHAARVIPSLERLYEELLGRTARARAGEAGAPRLPLYAASAPGSETP
jgi:glycosyltransferase involved in cell wall biosynthesis